MLQDFPILLKWRMSVRFRSLPLLYIGKILVLVFAQGPDWEVEFIVWVSDHAAEILVYTEVKGVGEYFTKCS